MIKRIILKNFMSHAETVIEPAEGLTVLVGPNNCGKSAVVAALQTLCSNARGDFMVRHGESECSVVVETTDEHVLEWIRKGSTVSYAINGEEIHRLGGGTPDTLHDYLRMPQVASSDGGDHYDIHFAEQKNPIFLLDKNGRHAATFFASSSDAALLLEMQRRHRRHVSENKTEEKRLNSELAHAEKQVAALEPVDLIDKKLQAAENLHEEIKKLESDLTGLASAIAALKRQQQAVAQFSARQQVMTTLSVPPELFDTPALELLCSFLQRQQHIAKYESNRSLALEELHGPPMLHDPAPLANLAAQISGEMSFIQAESERSAVMKRLEAPPVLAPITELEVLCDAMRRTARDFNRCTQRDSALEALNHPPEPLNVDAAADLVDRMQKATAGHQAEERKLEMLEKLLPVPQMADTEPLTELIAEMAASDEAVQDCSQAAELAGAELDAAADDIRDWAEANPTCPTCGATIDAERIITGGEIDGCR